MPQIDFPLGIKGTEELPRTRTLLVNCFNNGENKIISRPGIEDLTTLVEGNNARGSFVWNGSIYFVYGTDLIRLTNKFTGTYEVIGTIAGSPNIKTAIGFNHACILVPGIAIYSLDKSNTLENISGNPNFVPCNDVEHINGRFVFVPTSGDPTFFTDVGDIATVQVESFFDAEILPDKNEAAFSERNNLVIGGTDSFERFRDQGTATSFNPFRRIEGAQIENGFIGGLLKYGGSHIFVGREERQNFGFYRIAQGGAIKISNETIDLILSKQEEVDLKNIIPGRFKWRGYDIATYTLRNYAFGFYGGEWFFLETIIDGERMPWTAGFITEFEGEYFTAYENRMGKLAKVNTDYGERIPRIIEFGIENPDRDNFPVQSLELGVSQGFNAVDGSIGLQVSRDNLLYGPMIYNLVAEVGEYDKRLIWNPPGGLGDFDSGFMGTRIYTTEDVDFNADHLTVDL